MKTFFDTTFIYSWQNLLPLPSLGYNSFHTGYMPSNNVSLDFYQPTFQLLSTISAPTTKISCYTTIIHIWQNLLLLYSLGYRSSHTNFVIFSNISFYIYQLFFQLLPTVSAPATKMFLYTTIMYIEQNLLLVLSLWCSSSDTTFMTSSIISLDFY